MIICLNCMATGQLRGPRWLPAAEQVTKPCPTCKGSGRIHHKLVRWEICPSCEGWGTQIPLVEGSPCSKCEGVGMIPHIPSVYSNYIYNPKWSSRKTLNYSQSNDIRLTDLILRSWESNESPLKELVSHLVIMSTFLFYGSSSFICLFYSPASLKARTFSSFTLMISETTSIGPRL